MTLNRRSFLSMTAIATTLAAAAACGSSDSSDSSGTVAADTTADLVIWADEKKAPSVEEFATQWADQQGGLTVAVQVVADDLETNFITADSAGNGPDIVIGAHDWIGKLVQNNAIAPVVLSEKAQANYSDMALKAVTYNDQIYGAPYSVEALALYVNKGLTSKTAPATVEELVEAGRPPAPMRSSRCPSATRATATSCSPSTHPRADTCSEPTPTARTTPRIWGSAPRAR